VEAFRQAGGGPLVEELARTVEEMKRLAGLPSLAPAGGQGG
jgi:hypothetical protein